jgi:hypothetical protein
MSTVAKKIGADFCEECDAPLPTFKEQMDHSCASCTEKFWQKTFTEEKQRKQAFASAVLEASPALDRLMEVLKGRSGQPFKLRALLYSMWNGKPWTLNDIVCFDWQIKKDLCAVLLAWGHNNFFYTHLENAIRAVGQWVWFLEERNNVDLLREYVDSAEKQKGAKP